MKEKTALVGLLVLVVLASGCTDNKVEKYTSQAIASKNQTICHRIPDARTAYECAYKVAVSNDDTAMCATIGSDDWTNDCYANLSAKRKDLTVCDNIRLQTSRDECYKKAGPSI